MLVEGTQTQLVQRFLNYMIVSDTKGMMYSNIIERNIENLMKMGIDLKPYFESPLVFCKIDNPEKYPINHKSGRKLLTYTNFNSI